ncbi:hypothetical protein SAMN02927924_04008 [Sphingobium faniae]|nr:hypothetical protein SAMN02927924_04008 [Sphingobium faniae]
MKMNPSLAPHRRLFRLLHDNRAIAMVEFGLCLPFFLGAGLAATELTHYTITKMRISQAALHLADDGSRIGTGYLLSTKQISEAQINDLMLGSGLEASKLDLYTHGRVVISSLEPIARPNTTDRYRIRWQRCRGSKSYTSQFGRQGDTDLAGVTINGNLVKAPDDGAVIIAEVAYDYQPLFGGRWIQLSPMTETATMYVRDNREYSGPTGGVGIYNSENVAVSSCA